MPSPPIRATFTSFHHSGAAGGMAPSWRLEPVSAAVYAGFLVALLAALKEFNLLKMPEFLQRRSEDLTPLRAPKMLDLAELKDASYRDAMLWGSYRSGLYFGMRTRSPQSLLTGLMWFDPDSKDTMTYHKV